jgi:hypothetical protein
VSAWTTPAELRGRLLREWERGKLLDGSTAYPLRIALKGPPSAQVIADRFDEVRRWIRTLAEGAKAEGGHGYRLEYREFDHRQLGRNAVPVAACFDAESDALTFVGKRREAARFRELADVIVGAFPQLAGWPARRPLRVLEHAADWPRLLGVLRWIADHPRAGVYLRQIDVPDVHTKFIEGHRVLLGELLDLVLPPQAIAAEVPRGAGGFERRYGFRAKPQCVRLRLLCPHPNPLRRAGEGKGGGEEWCTVLTDVSIPAEDFARLRLPVRRVFVTENEINFLAFPHVADGMVVFGAGYGFDALAAAEWLRKMPMWYWGDIDTHGFAILDQLRAGFPHVRSLLMDRQTLMDHRPLWGREETATRRDLPRLQSDEANLYDDLRHDRIAPALRLEQERIGYARVVAALEALGR